ncbi:MAG: hypothetical protein O3C51_02645 [Planctomycetota bacterium]|nr:hypothetical protein [Planctomycetota bacterium]
MDLGQSRRRIEEVVAPATESLRSRRDRAAFRVGIAAGVQALPTFAAILALGWFGGTFVAEADLFDPLLLPLLLLLPPVGMALGARAAARRHDLVDARAAARVLDRNHGTKDRLSAALELAGDPDSERTDRRAALARLAVADGVAALAGIDATRTEVADATIRLPWAHAAFALVIALAPAVLPRGGESAPDADPAEVVAAADPEGARDEQQPESESDARDDADPAARPEVTPATPTRTTPRERRVEDRPAEEQPEETGPSPEPKRSAGRGASGSDAAGERGRRSTSSSESQSASSGQASAGGQGGGGQGSAKSETPPDAPKEPRKQTPRKPSQKGQRPSSTEGGEQEPSAGNPSGPSRGGGKMAAVGNQRSGMERGSERDDDPDADDEDVEDEKEETEQRGGVMPMTRDRMQAPSRELSISGNGPPDDGRGGPTPPKKSRGTASLVLGVRLPDQVRGQTNPGTAKTTIEQIPPVPQAEAPRPASPARSEGPSPNVQTPARPLGDLAETVRRYHELLRGPSTRSASQKDA